MDAINGTAQARLVGGGMVGASVRDHESCSHNSRIVYSEPHFHRYQNIPLSEGCISGKPSYARPAYGGQQSLL